MAWMIVRGPTWSTIVEAPSHEKAKERVLSDHGLALRKELSRDWRVRLATEDEVRTHQAVMAKLGKAQLLSVDDQRRLSFD